MDEFSTIFFLGGLVLVVLLGPWVLLLRSGIKQRRQRQEDQIRLSSLTERIFSLEAAVRELKRTAASTAPYVSPVQEETKAVEQTPAPPPVVKPPEVVPSSARSTAEAWVTKTSPPPPEPPPVRSTAPPVPTTPITSPSYEAAPTFSSTIESPSFVQTVKSALDVEEALGTNWLPKIGISFIVLALAFLIDWQLKNLGPAGRILLGYVIGGLMLAAGIWFERRERYRVLARAGVGGGWALLFFVTYAMYHIAAARILHSQLIDLVLMLAVAGVMVWHTLKYRSQVVTGLTFLLAFLTLTISHETVYSLTAGVVLAAALVAIVGKMQWFELEIFGIAASYLNHFLWLRRIIEPMHGKHRMFPEFYASAGILSAYWIIYRISYVVRRPSDSKQENISAAAALLNAVCLLGLLKYQSVHPEWAFWALLFMGGVEILFAEMPITRRRRTAVIVLSTLGTVLLVAAFPFRYSGARLSVLWLAEAEAIFLLGVFVREVVFRRIGMLATAIVAGQMIAIDAARIYGMRSDGAYVHSDPGLTTIFLVAAVIFYGNAHWIFPGRRELFASTFDLIFIQRCSYVACILLWIGAWIAFPEAWTAVSWCGLGLVLALASRRFEIPELGYQGKIVALIAAIRVLAVNLDSTAKVHGLTLRLVTTLLVAALLYVTARSRVDDRGRSLTVSRRSYPYSDLVGGCCTWIASFLLSLLAWYELRPVSVAVVWTMFGVVLLELGVGRRSIALRLQAYVALLSGFLRILFVNLNASGVPGEISPRFYTIVPIALAFFYAYERLHSSQEQLGPQERSVATNFSCYLGTITLAALMRFELEADWVAAAWAAIVFLAAAIAWRLGRRVFLHQALVLSFAVLFRAVLHNFYERSYFPAPGWEDRRLCVGVAIAFLIASLPFAFRLRQKEVGEGTGVVRLLRIISSRPEQVFFFNAIACLTVLLTVESRHGMITLAWGLEALCVFMFAVWVGERSFRLTGLALLLLCVSKIIVVDVWRLHGLDRIMTLLVLGTALFVASLMYTRYRETIRQYL
jgi:uncharacterized membrane protein